MAVFEFGGPLRERLAQGRLPPMPTESDRLGLARRRFERWRRQPPFDDDELWQARLAEDGLTGSDLLALLAEPARETALRMPVGQHSGTNPRVDPSVDPASVDPATPFFARAVAPLLDLAGNRLRADLDDLASENGSMPYTPEDLVEQLAGDLSVTVHRMLGRSLMLELHVARLRGELVGESSAARFGSFLARLSDPSWRTRLFTEYPVLARQLTIAADQWVANGSRLARRLAADAEEIRAVFDVGQGRAEGGPGKAIAVRLGAGDRHRGGQSVAEIRWDNGRTVMYKPRPVRLEQLWGELVHWLNQVAASESDCWLPLHACTVLDRGDYGWVEFVAPEPCRHEAEIRRFYRRQGQLLALLGLLRANDIHAENLIASRDHPVLVDLETLVRPELPTHEPGLCPAERVAAEALSTSVLQAGLLPTLTWHSRDGRAADISGLGRRSDQESPIRLPTLTDVGTDMMRLEPQRVRMELPNHRPVGSEVPLNLLDYADDVVAGFTEAHQLCRKHRDELLDESGPLGAFAGAPVRVLIRSTIHYDTVLRTGFHPDVLRDGLDRDRHFDYLRRDLTSRPALAPCLRPEQNDLWNNDIPVFTTTTDGSVMYDSQGQPVPDFELVPGLPLVRQDLLAWDEKHLDGQLNLIRGSLGAAAINASEKVRFPEYELRWDTPVATSSELLASAEELGDRLIRTGFRSDGSAQWLGLSVSGPRDCAVGPLRPELYNGLCGVTLFLAHLGRLTGEPRFVEIARAGLTTVHGQLARGAAADSLGMIGRPGVVYTFCALADLLDDESLIDAAGRLLPEIRDAIEHEQNYDVIAGAAGTIGCLRALHRIVPDGPAIDLIAAAAERLRRTARQTRVGCGWLSTSMLEGGIADEPLTGFSHGAAGFAWALAVAADLLDDPRYADLAREALSYERDLFQPDTRDWRDLRKLDGTDVTCAWCHGAVGIGLSRVALKHLLPDEPLLDEEISHALKATEDAGFGISHSLCHGDLGALDLLLLAADDPEHPELIATAARRAAAIRASIHQVGPISGVAFGLETPGLMIGTAGIGYGLLRAAAPRRVPSVLLLDSATETAGHSATHGRTRG